MKISAAREFSQYQPWLGRRPGPPPTGLGLAAKDTDGAGNAGEQKIDDDRRPIPYCKEAKRTRPSLRDLKVEHAGGEREHGQAPQEQHERARHVTGGYVMVVRVVHLAPPTPQEMRADDHTDHLEGQRAQQHGGGRRLSRDGASTCVVK